MNISTKLLFDAYIAVDEDIILKLLKNNDIDTTEIDKFCMTLLHYSVQHRLSKVVQEL